MSDKMVELGDYPLKFSKDECSKVKYGHCPFEMNKTDFKKRIKEINELMPFDENTRNDFRCCYVLALNMKKSYAKERIDVGMRNGKIVRVNNGRHRLCIGKKMNKKVKAWVEIE